MRIKILILSFLILIALFATNSCSVNWDNPESQTVDEMFAGDAGSNNTSSDFPQTPFESRSNQAGQKNKAILTTPIAGKLTTVALSPQEARSLAEPQTTTTSSAANNTTETIIPPAATNTAAAAPLSTPASVEGGWSFDLVDSTQRAASLTLFQSGDAIYGTGNLRLDANTTLMATASGTLTGDKLFIDLVTLERLNLYRLALTMSADTADGSYTAFSPSAPPSTGTANGLRSV
jgi:hypothetical protein